MYNIDKLKGEVQSVSVLKHYSYCHLENDEKEIREYK